MTRYALSVETDAYGKIVRATATAHPRGWTVQIWHGLTELGTGELGSITALEAAEQLVLRFTSVLMTIDIGRHGAPTHPPRPGPTP